MHATSKKWEWPGDEATLERFVTCATDHYDRIARNYDTHYKGLHKAILPVILDKMKFVPDSDVLLDLGSGTGTLAHTIKREANLKHNVICVEPSEAMVSEAKVMDGIIVCQSTAEEFISSKSVDKYLFNKVLIAFCSHHFVHSRRFLFEKFSERLPAGGAILIIDRKQETCLPLFKLALEKHHKAHANDLTSDQYSDLVGPLGFEVKSWDITLEYVSTKLLWYKTLRERFISFMYEISDEEIEDGIRELEVCFDKVEDNDNIEIKDSVVVHKLIKRT